MRRRENKNTGLYGLHASSLRQCYFSAVGMFRHIPFTNNTREITPEMH